MNEKLIEKIEEAICDAVGECPRINGERKPCKQCVKDYALMVYEYNEGDDN